MGSRRAPAGGRARACAPSSASRPTRAVALTVGSLTRQKAQHDLIEACAAVARDGADARLLIAGDGPLRATLETLARERAIAERVRLLGARQDVGDLIAAADVFVLSSIREGLSVTLLEAMRAGAPRSPPMSAATARRWSTA